MTLDRELLAEKVAAVERHLARVADRLPPDAPLLRPSTDVSDAVVLHLWQATQIVVDIALALCARLRLGTPASYADAFRRLEAQAGLPSALADTLVRAAGFRNVVAHAYEALDMARVHLAAVHGPSDLRAFLRFVRDTLDAPGQPPRTPSLR